MKVVIAKNQSDLDNFFPLLLELRPHLSKEIYLEIYKNAHENESYDLVGFYDDSNELLGLIGYRIIYDFVRGRHLYIDDLVTSEKKRSSGVGALMLKHAEEKARELKCTGGLRLCAALTNERGIKFYEKNDWVKRAYALVKKI